MDLNRKVDMSKYSQTDMPEYPARTLLAHCTLKGIQLGSVIGLTIATPALSIYRGGSRYAVWTKVMPVSLVGGNLFLLVNCDRYCMLHE